MSSTGYRWKSPLTGEAHNENNEEASSISDVFADMLNANEDLIVATAESQAEGDIDGLIAYQRILHRDLMEMAEFIDSMYGVYSNCSTNSKNDDSLSSFRTKSSHGSPPMVVEQTTECAGGQDSELAGGKSVFFKKRLARKKTQRGALLSAIEAEEKSRETQRSKEQWIKSRHRVLEEEGASAIMNQNLNGMLEMATVKAGETHQGSAGIALVNQLRAHQHIAAILETSKKTSEKQSTAIGSNSPTPHVTLLPPNNLAMPAATSTLGTPASVSHVNDQQYIKPANVGNSVPKIALPPAHSIYNMLLAYPGAAQLIFNPHVARGFMPMPQWQPQLQTPIPARSVAAVRHTDSKFKRMCQSCRKRHLSVRQCRLVLQHTDPEWQPVQPPTAGRRRRKQSAPNTT